MCLWASSKKKIWKQQNFFGILKINEERRHKFFPSHLSPCYLTHVVNSCRQYTVTLLALALTVKLRQPLLPTHGGEKDTHDFSGVVCLVDYYTFSLINTIDALCNDPVAVHFIPPRASEPWRELLSPGQLAGGFRSSANSSPVHHINTGHRND